jgi:hypothetical protein
LVSLEIREPADHQDHQVLWEQQEPQAMQGLKEVLGWQVLWVLQAPQG